MRRLHDNLGKLGGKFGSYHFVRSSHNLEELAGCTDYSKHGDEYYGAIWEKSIPSAELQGFIDSKSLDMIPPLSNRIRGAYYIQKLLKLPESFERNDKINSLIRRFDNAA